MAGKSISPATVTRALATLHRLLRHQLLRQTLKMPRGFVLHSLRHTYQARLGEAGADTFTIMRLMGHSSITVSQRYVPPNPEAQESAVERLEKLNARGRRAITGAEKRQLPATPQNANVRKLLTGR